MNKYYQKIVFALFGALFISNSYAETDKLILFPAFKDNWDADLAVAATVGYMDIGNDVAGGGPAPLMVYRRLLTARFSLFPVKT